MHKTYHPNSWLSGFRNVRPGLERRSEILHILEQDSETAEELSKKVDVTYSTVLYHLHNLEDKGIIERAPSKPPYAWKVTLVGQQRLTNY